eukprot:COSAG02_NODE_307_length_25111_cov_5.306693_12_plen_86_part_00
MWTGDRNTDAARTNALLSADARTGRTHVWTISHAGDGYLIVCATKAAQLPYAPTVAHPCVPEPQSPVLRTRREAAPAPRIQRIVQ